jgi:hypothetical protein
VLTDAINNFQIQSFFLLISLLAQSVGLLKPVSNLVMEIDFLLEHLSVILNYLLLIGIAKALSEIIYFQIFIFLINHRSQGVFIP